MHLECRDDALLLRRGAVNRHLIAIAREEIEQCPGVHLLIARPPVCIERDARQIGPCANALPGKLSIGERQRAAIARALLPKPELVLADEPTAALDPVTAKNVMRLFTELAGECALVVVSHDHRLVEENGFRCLRLDVDGGGGSINTTLRG